MKTKHVILGLFAFVFAIGSAFTSSSLATTAFIKVRYSHQPAGTYSCVNTTLICNDIVGSACRVTISDLAGAQALARSNSSCPTPNLFDGTGVIGAYNDAMQIVEIKNN
jgi:hypothetical protein